MIVDEDLPQEKSTDVTDFLVDEFNISLKTTSGDASCLNGNNESHNRSIHNMVISDLLGINQHENKWCCEAEIPAELYRCNMHSSLDNTSPQFVLYGNKPIMNELKNFGCDIYPITFSPKTLYDRKQEGLLMGYTNKIATMKWR